MLKRGLGQLLDRASSQLRGALNVPPAFLSSSDSYAAVHAVRPAQRFFNCFHSVQHAAAAPQPARAAEDTFHATDGMPPPTAAQSHQDHAVEYTVNVKSFLLGSQLDLARLKPKFRRELR